MRFVLPFAALLAATTLPASSQETPEVEACRTSGLIALKERNPSIRDVFIDQDSLTIAKGNTKVEDTPVRTIIFGEAYLEKGRKEKPHRFVCLIGEKGKVLLTFFTER